MPINKFGHHSTKYRAYDDDDYDDADTFNLHDKRIVNISVPVNDNDAVNKKYLEEALNKIVKKLDEHTNSTYNLITTATQIIKKVSHDNEELYKHLKLEQPSKKKSQSAAKSGRASQAVKPSASS